MSQDWVFEKGQAGRRVIRPAEPKRKAVDHIKMIELVIL